MQLDRVPANTDALSNLEALGIRTQGCDTANDLMAKNRGVLSKCPSHCSRSRDRSGTSHSVRPRLRPHRPRAVQSPPFQESSAVSVPWPPTPYNSSCFLSWNFARVGWELMENSIVSSFRLMFSRLHLVSRFAGFGPLQLLRSQRANWIINRSRLM
jgi:hypothetical protein